MPSCELPAIRMMASEIFETFGAPPAFCAVNAMSLMKFLIQSLTELLQGQTSGEVCQPEGPIAWSAYAVLPFVSIANPIRNQLIARDLPQLHGLLELSSKGELD